jgi:MHS family proline/betaine transporter-like MFS transporter
MALPTFLIGALPTYEQIGSWASALLILMRFLQGLSVGGEYTTSSIFLVERSNPGRRGFLGSFVPLGSCAGVLLGSAIGAALTTVLDQSAVASWGWRIPFLIGLTIGIFGLYIRRHMIADEVIQSEHAHLASPLGEAFRTEWRTIVRLIALGAEAPSASICLLSILRPISGKSTISRNRKLWTSIQFRWWCCCY